MQSQLAVVHSVIEMISMLEFFLKIPNQNLSALAREMIQHYERNATAENYIFEFIVPTVVGWLSTVNLAARVSKACQEYQRSDNLFVDIKPTFQTFNF